LSRSTAARIVDQPMTPRPADSDAPTIFLVDGWVSFRRSLRLFLESSGHRVVGEADTVARALRTHRLPDADVVVLEASPSWVVLQRDLGLLRRAAPAAAVVLLSSEPIPALVVVQAVRAGVSAYLTKQDGPEELRHGIAAALSKDFVFVPRQLLHRTTVPRDEAISLIATGDGQRLGLTRRELEILSLATESFSNREIAEIMWISLQAIKFHLANVYRKLGVSNRDEAIEFARTMGLFGRGEAA
jgi:DNA-binding NarL/FixJ family response regulator